MRRSAFAFGLALMAAGPTAAAEFALVVGVDDYVFQRPLKGAANDARDIALALQGRDLADLKVLLNQAATKEAVIGAWNDLLDQAEKGDTIIFTYAGHGAAEPDRNGDEKTATHPDDVLDEAFLLANFTDRSPAGFAERIVDDELNIWFSAADDKGVRVVFLADSCHSGTMTRQASSTRFAGEYEAPDGAETDLPPPPRELDNVFFIAGARQDQAVPEVTIAGQMRGAASYAFARALEGAADSDGDGVVTRDELAHYVAAVAASFSDQAEPSVLPLSRGQEPVFGGAPGVRPPAPDRPRVTLAAASGSLVGRFGADLIRDYGAATLNWDEDEGVVANSEGDSVAHNVGGKIAMRRVVEKYKLLELAKQSAGARPIEAKLSGGARIWNVGEETELVIGARALPYLTVFTLSNAGQVALAYPYDDKEAGPQDGQRDIRFVFEVTSDGVGVEHVVALASEQAPAELRDALRDGGPSRRIFPLVDALMDGREIEAGVARIVTRKP